MHSDEVSCAEPPLAQNLAPCIIRNIASWSRKQIGGISTSSFDADPMHPRALCKPEGWRVGPCQPQSARGEEGEGEGDEPPFPPLHACIVWHISGVRGREHHAIARHIERTARGETRRTAERFLIRYGSRAVPALIRACSDGRPEVRFSVGWVLGLIGDNRAFDVLAKLADDPDDRVQYDAQWALGHLGDMRALPLLIEKAKQDRTGGAWYGLTLVGPPAVPYLEEMLRSEDEGLVAGALDLLARIVPERASELVAPYLQHPSALIRAAAANAMDWVWRWSDLPSVCGRVARGEEG